MRVPPIVPMAGEAAETTEWKLFRFRHQAMATWFTFFLPGRSSDGRDFRMAAYAAFDEIDRIEGELSCFIPSSDIARINKCPAGRWMPIGGTALECLRIAQELFDQTDGAFDPTAGGLLAGRTRWDDVDGDSLPPRTGEVCGFEHVCLDTAAGSVSRQRGGVVLDLGGIGKGYALDQAAEVLRDWGIDSALLSSGQSTMVAVGVPPGGAGWQMRLLNPLNETEELGSFSLVSGAVGASSASEDPHIIDPRTGEPSQGCAGVWCLAPSGAKADALATAFGVMESGQVREFCSRYPENSALLIKGGTGGLSAWSSGPWPDMVLKCEDQFSS